MVPLFMDAMDRYFRDSIYLQFLPGKNRSASIDIKSNPDNLPFNIITSLALPEINNAIEYEVGQNVANTGINGYWMYMIPTAQSTKVE